MTEIWPQNKSNISAIGCGNGDGDGGGDSGGDAGGDGGLGSVSGGDTSGGGVLSAQVGLRSCVISQSAEQSIEY